MKVNEKVLQFSAKKHTITLCTLFDSFFLAQGLALIRSVERNSSIDIFWIVLAMDKPTFKVLKSLKKNNLHLLDINDFPDLELKLVRANRPWHEFCWTATPCLLKYCLSISEPGTLVAYIDADCFFFGDIVEICEPFSDGVNIAIHEHRFSPDRSDWLAKSGRFNVGVVAGVKSDEFCKCIDRWRSQVLHRSDVDPQTGHCGDQGYLNEWPNLYTSLYIYESPGIGLAPWNIKNYKIKSEDEQFEIDNRPLIFFHFSAIEFISFSRNLALFVCATGYLKMKGGEKQIYRKYVKELMEVFLLFGYSPKLKRSLRFSLSVFLRGELSILLSRRR